MYRTSLNHDTIRKYLLGILSDSEEQAIAAALLDEPDVQVEELIRSTERNLISDYIHGRLLEKEKEMFGNYFLISPARQDLLWETWFGEALGVAYPDLQLAYPNLAKGRPERSKGILERIRQTFQIPVAVPVMGAMDTSVPVQAAVALVGTPNEDFIVINCGGEMEVKVGDVFDVFPDPSSTSLENPFEAPPVGTVTITSVGAGRSWGRYQGEKAPKVGDLVRTHAV
jgi:hypothetical protein